MTLYVMTLRPGPGYRLGTPSEATVTVRDDDAPPSVSIADADAVTEGGTLAFPVTLSGPYNTDIAVAYTLGGTAAEGGDYTDGGSGALTVAAGDTEGTIELATVDDSTDEAREEVEVTLAAGASYTLGAPSAATGRILDNEGLPEVTVAAAADAVTEGEDAVFILTREDGDASGALEVPVAIGDASGVLLPGAPSSAAFEAGASTATLRLGTDDDTLDEPDAEVTLALAAGAAWTLGAPSEAAVAVRDNEAPPTVSVADADAVVEGGTLEFVVSLNHASHATIAVDYSFGGTAAAGTDYLGAASGAVTFTPGVTEQTIRLVTVGNDTDEADRTVTATLAAPDPALAVLGQATAEGRIEDDERPVVTIAPDAITVREGQDAAFTLTRVGDLSVSLTVPVTVAAEGAGDEEVDAVFQTGSATVPLAVATSNDNIDDPDDSAVTVTLRPGAAWDLGTPSEATVTVRDNDPRPTVSITRENVTEGGTLRFKVKLNRRSAAAIPIDYTVTDLGATAGVDYLGPASGTVTFAPGDKEKLISIETVDDDIDELAESLQVTLLRPDSRLAQFPNVHPVGIGGIRDNDRQVVTVAAVTDAFGEWDTDDRKMFRVTRTQGDDISKSLTVAFTIGDEDDVLTTAPLPTSVTFDPADWQKVLLLAVDDDEVDEDDAEVTLTLSAGTSYRLGASRRAAVTVWDDDGSRPTVFIRDAAPVTEGGTLEFPVGLVHEFDGEIRLDVFVSGDPSNFYVPGESATASKDFRRPDPYPASVTFASGETAKTLRVETLNDGYKEPDEWVLTRISKIVTTPTDGDSDVDNLLIPPSPPRTISAIGRILDDGDPTVVTVRAQRSSFAENYGGAAFVLKRTGDNLEGAGGADCGDGSRGGADRNGAGQRHHPGRARSLHAAPGHPQKRHRGTRRRGDADAGRRRGLSA